jgi:hypothetical protein
MLGYISIQLGILFIGADPSIFNCHFALQVVFHMHSACTHVSTCLLLQLSNMPLYFQLAKVIFPA